MKKIISVIMLAALALTALNINAFAERGIDYLPPAEKIVTVDGMIFGLYPQEGKAALIGYDASCKSKVDVPDTVESLPVTEVERNSFDGNTKLKYLTLEVIGVSAFENCSSLKRVELGGTVQISQSAFFSCSSLEEIVFGQRLEKIGSAAFDGCVSLKSIALPDSVKQVGYLAFENCSELKDVTLPVEIESIGHHAFGITDGYGSLMLENGHGIHMIVAVKDFNINAEPYSVGYYYAVSNGFSINGEVISPETLETEKTEEELAVLYAEKQAEEKAERKKNTKKDAIRTVKYAQIVIGVTALGVKVKKYVHGSKE